MMFISKISMQNFPALSSDHDLNALNTELTLKTNALATNWPRNEDDSSTRPRQISR